MFFGGDKRIRTAGLLVANEALYQLSHIPMNEIYYIPILLLCQEFFYQILEKNFQMLYNFLISNKGAIYAELAER